MATQRQLGVTLGQYLLTPAGGIVLEHEYKREAPSNLPQMSEALRGKIQTCKCLVDIAFLGGALGNAPVLHTCHNDGVGIAMNDAVFIQEQVETHFANDILRQLTISLLFCITTSLVDIIVVIAQYSIDAIKTIMSGA